MKMGKEQLKFLIKECVKEVIFEEGFLSNIISEVVIGLNPGPLVEQKKEAKKASFPRTPSRPKTKISETRERLLEAVGKDSYGGVDLFEGTKPLTHAQAEGSTAQGSLSSMDPSDPGVNIDNIPGVNMWKHLIK